MLHAPPPLPDPPPLKVNKRATPRQATSAAAYEFAYLDLPDEHPLLGFAPYLHTAPRANSITPDVQRAFVLHLAQTGIVVAAAKRVGKSMEALYKLRARRGAEGFAKAWDEALAWGVMRLEDCAMERALNDGLYNPHANSMLCFVLAHRKRHMVDSRLVKPGHWLYESIRYELTGEVGEITVADDEDYR